MKNITVSLLIICFGFLSCSNPSSQKNTVVNNVPDTAGYFAARNMKGIASFKIGETNYSQALKIIRDEIRKDYQETNSNEMPKYRGYEPKFMVFKYDKNGNPVSWFYREDYGSIIKEVKYDTLKSYLKGDLDYLSFDTEIFGCPKIKSINMFSYYIGDIELTRFELKFYQDTLYKISCSQNDKIEDGFKAKYGNGRLIDNSVWKTPRGKTNVRPENDAIRKKSQLLKIDKEHIWENESVMAVSLTYIEYKHEDTYSSLYFVIESKNTKLKDKITECEDVAIKAKQRLEEQKKQKEFNLL